MADRRQSGGGAYWLRYLAVSGVILAVTWAVVTRVLPPRLVPNADFRERAVRFSTEPPSYELPERLVFTPASVVATSEPAGADSAARPRLGERGRLWRDLDPLLAAGRWEEARPLLEAYLADHPADAAVRLELARVLARSGRVEEAEAQYRRLAEAGDARGIIGLAHVLWRQNRLEPAAERFRRALEMRPDDEGIRSSLARVLRAAERYPEAERHFRVLVESSEQPREYRIELARTLLWAGRPREAVAELRRAGGPEAAELARGISARLALPSPDSALADPLSRARRARAGGRTGEAASLYRLATHLRPSATAAWLEWADLLALDMGKPERAVAVLEEHAAQQGEIPAAARSRTARYAAWSGEEALARRLLTELDREGEATPRDLVLLGDLLRWADERRRSDEAYRGVLAARAADSAAARRAERGLEELRARDRAVVDARDPRRVELAGSRFDDSDGFGRTGIGAAALLGSGAGLGRFVAAADWTRLEGARVPGSGTAAGAEVGYVRWLDHATARVEVRAGREQRGAGAGGTSRFTGDLLLLDRLGDRIGVTLSRRPAHELTQSLASLRRGQTATGAGLRLAHAPTDATSVSARVRADVLHAGGTGRSVRLLGTGNWLGTAAGDLRLGVASRLVSHTEPAFTVDGRPGYWSPELSWTPSAVADWRVRPGETGWGFHARLQPGVSVVREHGAEDVVAGGSVSATGGALYRWARATAEASLGWIRSRAGEYDALSATLGVSWRF